ncbi:MAG: HAMP domain-containing histidine kinase [bacterium]|nr:HAMP domain-containing histidine kinase [bacterium]
MSLLATPGLRDARVLPIGHGMQAQDKLRCNARIAAGMLDALAAVGDVAGHGCVRRVFEVDRVNARAGGVWVPRKTIDRAFRALGQGRDFARRVGYGLVSNERIGFVLFVEGVATIEKAFRRCDALFAREDSTGQFQTLEVADGLARIAYHPGPGGDRDEEPVRAWNTDFCGVRQGMLEALPLGFGLLPARVTESQCVGDGAPHCCFEVCFDTGSRRGTWAGLGMGSAAAMVLAGWAAASGALPLWAVGIGASMSLLLGFVAGRATDLAKQLEAVAGARRGHLALLEQADRALAEKMDELAKLRAYEGSGSEASTDRLRAILAERHEVSDEDERAGHTAAPPKSPSDERSGRAAYQIYEALGPLQRGLERIQRLLSRPGDEEGDSTASMLEALRDCVDESRRLGSVGAALAKDLGEAECRYQPTQLAEVVSRAIDSARPMLLPEQGFEVAIEQPLPLVRCEPFQMEQVAYQLLRNAAQASADDGQVGVTLRAEPGGVEFVIEDCGCGIAGEILDQVFDPFAVETEAQGSRGLGLAICYRIVSEHGGELRVATEAGEGTRITVSLPSDALAAESIESEVDLGE